MVEWIEVYYYSKMIDLDSIPSQSNDYKTGINSFLLEVQHQKGRKDFTIESWTSQVDHARSLPELENISPSPKTI